MPEEELFPLEDECPLDALLLVLGDFDVDEERCEESVLLLVAVLDARAGFADL